MDCEKVSWSLLAQEVAQCKYQQLTFGYQKTRLVSFVLSDNLKNGFATTDYFAKRLVLGTPFSVLKGSCLLEQ